MTGFSRVQGTYSAANFGILSLRGVTYVFTPVRLEQPRPIEIEHCNSRAVRTTDFVTLTVTVFVVSTRFWVAGVFLFPFPGKI